MTNNPQHHPPASSAHLSLSIYQTQVGVLSELPDTIVRTKARLEPGKMFLVDFEKGDIIPDSGAW